MKKLQIISKGQRGKSALFWEGDSIMEYKGKFDFFYGRESERLDFITIPKLLLKDPHFKKISAEAKLLYGCLLDRNSLSQKNGWVDECNRVYVIYTIAEMKCDLCCASEKVCRVLKELEIAGLVYRKRNGQGKANWIYVMDYMAVYRKEDSRLEEKEYPKGCSPGLEERDGPDPGENSESREGKGPDEGEKGFQNFENRKSRVSKFENLEFRFSKSNKTDNNKTDHIWASRPQRNRNRFCDFPQRDYDFEALERMLLSNKAPPPGPD